MPANAKAADPSTGRTQTMLPAAPETATMWAEIRARLHAIENEALPAIVARRRLLEKTWITDTADAVPLYAHDNEIIPTHPAGAERLSATLAEQYALILEVDALRELAQALARYDAGGSALLSELDATEVDMMQLVRAPASVPVVLDSCDDERAYMIELLRYLSQVRTEIWAARRDHDVARRQRLELESRELEQRIQQRSATVTRPSPSAPAGAVPERAVPGGRSLRSDTSRRVGAR
ncbi:MAG TPA: hypothetical protein VHB25_08065 [Gemmatimonadaceae bacterium]|nr:hypothetical protein [Gemmatimonadaceae bacterium]